MGVLKRCDQLQQLGVARKSKGSPQIERCLRATTWTEDSAAWTRRMKFRLVCQTYCTRGMTADEHSRLCDNVSADRALYLLPHRIGHLLWFCRAAVQKTEKNKVVAGSLLGAQAIC